MRMDELSQDLSEALDRAERESRRNRLFGELGGSIDLEELMDRVLDAAMQIPGFDAAMIVVEGQTGAPTVVTRGMTPQETAKPPTSGVVGALPGTMTVTYRYGRDRQPPDSELICGGVFIPLIGRELGRSECSRSSGAARARTGGGAARAGGRPGRERHPVDRERPSLRRGAQGGGDRRPYGPLQPALLPRDPAPRGLRAQRYERKLALILFDLDDFKSINDQIGHLAGDRVLAQAAERLREAVRSVDVAVSHGRRRVRRDPAGVERDDADQLYRRVQNSMRGTTLGRTTIACASRPASPRSSTATRLPGCSSAPTRRSTARRISARTARTSHA